MVQQPLTLHLGLLIATMGLMRISTCVVGLVELKVGAERTQGKLLIIQMVYARQSLVLRKVILNWIILVDTQMALSLFGVKGMIKQVMKYVKKVKVCA